MTKAQLIEVMRIANRTYNEQLQNDAISEQARNAVEYYQRIALDLIWLLDNPKADN